MANLIRAVKLKSHKERTCSQCSNPIKKNEEYWKELWENQIRWNIHIKCDKFLTTREEQRNEYLKNRDN